ncbi:MAG TPA: hypothetical protein ENI20_19980 [Bacteroides sp.]|nr:hypothetical protein [Bacteroides sp.]
MQYFCDGRGLKLFENNREGITVEDDGDVVVTDKLRVGTEDVTQGRLHLYGNNSTTANFNCTYSMSSSCSLDSTSSLASFTNSSTYSTPFFHSFHFSRSLTFSGSLCLNMSNI